MTVGAFADLGVVLAFFEVTDEAGAIGYGDVIALDYLGMAGCAPELFSSFQIGKVNLMVKNDFFKLYLPFQQPFVMTSLAEAALVRYFRPRLGFQVELCPVSPDHHQAFDFSPDLRPKSRSKVAGAAFDFTVRGFLPALVKRLHVMTGRAEF